MITKEANRVQLGLHLFASPSSGSSITGSLAAAQAAIIRLRSENVFYVPFYGKYDHFTKKGSGRT
jgi:hypothetical protein